MILPLNNLAWAIPSLLLTISDDLGIRIPSFAQSPIIHPTHQSYGLLCPISSNEREKGHPCLGQRSADESPMDCWVTEPGVPSWLFPLLSMASSRQIIVIIIGCIFLATSVPVVAAVTSARTATTSERMQVRMAKRNGSPLAAQKNGASSKSSTSSVVPNAAKPRCKRANEVQWSCKSCSVCSYNGTSWTQICQCYTDTKSACFVPGGGATVQACTPTVSQKKALDNEQEKQLQVITKERNRKMVMDEYDSMVKFLEQMDALLPTFDGATSTLLFQLSTQFADLKSRMKVYYDKAKNGSFQSLDLVGFNDITETADSVFDRFISIGKAARATEKAIPIPTQIIIQPLPSTQPSPQRATVNCEQERRRAASLGITSDFSWAWYMVEIGCTSKEAYCAAAQRIGWSGGGHCS